MKNDVRDNETLFVSLSSVNIKEIRRIRYFHILIES